MTYADKYVNLTPQEVFDKHQEELCNMCAWTECGQYSTEACEGIHCVATVDRFMEQEVAE